MNKTPGTNPTILSYNASTVKIYNATALKIYNATCSLARFGNKLKYVVFSSTLKNVLA
jgi:hypothetical protein